MLLLFNIGQLRQDSDMLHFFFSDCINNIPCTRVKKNLQLLSIAAIRTRHLRRIGPWKGLKTTFLRLIDRQ